jgi:ABC-type uncharacterized transport system substrate-binding protein
VRSAPRFLASPKWFLQRTKRPTIYPWPFFVEEGRLLSYGSEMQDEFRDAVSYVDRILKGEKQMDLPVQALTKYELTLNMTTAKALGLKVSQQFQQLADKIIE